jgi:group I intron endonuclease
MISCIYQIRNTKNNRIYIGSTQNLKTRKTRHLRELKRGIHHNLHLQRAYNKHGNTFVFEVLETCTAEQLFKKEEEWINKLAPDYNIGGVSGGDNYTNHPNKEMIKEKLVKILEKSWATPTRLFGQDNPNWKNGATLFTCPICKQTITKSHKKQKTCGKCRDRSEHKNPFYGKTHLEKTKEKISRSKKGRKNPQAAKRCCIDGIYYRSATDAAQQLGMKNATVSHRLRSKNFKNWFYVTKFPSGG